MTEDLVLLAVTGDKCSGPAHLPARAREIVFNPASNGMRTGSRMQSLEAATRRCDGWLPLVWPARCGAEGHLYVRTGVDGGRRRVSGVSGGGRMTTERKGANQLVLPPNATLVSKGFPAGVTECAHDWRVNPAVCATTDGPEWGLERELWTCVKCQVQVAGPRLRPHKPSTPVSVFDPSTWERRP